MNNKILKIFMYPQEFPCGEQSSCCGPIGQSEEEIQSLKSSIEKELGYGVEVLNAKNDDDMRNYPRIVQLVRSLGPTALPILTLEDEVVSIGNTAPEEALAAILEKTEKKEFGKDNKARGNDSFEEASGQESTVNVQVCRPSASGSGDCCPPDSSSSGKSWKMLVFLVIVVAAGGVLAHSLINKSNSTNDQTQQLFSTIQPEGKSDTPLPLNTAIKAEVSNEAAPTLWRPELDSLASLNKVAADTDAVFVFLSDASQEDKQAITKEIEAAGKKIQSGGYRISAFGLSENAPNYAQLAKQFPIPCVMAIVKGRGASVVSGEITETKLVEAFVMASRPTSGCCPSSAGPADCK